MMMDALMVAEYEVGCTAIGTAAGILDLTTFEADMRRGGLCWRGSWSVRVVKEGERKDSRTAELVELETGATGPMGLAVYPLYGRQAEGGAL